MAELDPTAEFADDDPEGIQVAEDAAAKAAEEVAEKAAAKAAADSGAAEIADLRTKYTEALRDIEGLKGTAQVMAQIKELFTGKPSDPKEAFLQAEIRKRVPELNDVAQIKVVLGQVATALKAEADERLEEKVSNATDVLRGLMSEIGLDEKDEDAVAYLEEAVSREIRTNEELLKAWTRGNVRSAVNKAFEKIQAKLFAPARVRAKRSAVNTIIESPKASSRSTTLASREIKPAKVDLRDTSREGVKKIHDAAFERLQELTGE